MSEYGEVIGPRPEYLPASVEGQTIQLGVDGVGGTVL